MKLVIPVDDQHSSVKEWFARYGFIFSSEQYSYQEDQLYDIIKYHKKSTAAYVRQVGIGCEAEYNFPLVVYAYARYDRLDIDFDLDCGGNWYGFSLYYKDFNTFEDVLQEALERIWNYHWESFEFDDFSIKREIY